MEIEKLIERLQNWDGIKPDREIDCAIEGLKALQAENDRLRRERDDAIRQLRFLHHVLAVSGTEVSRDARTNLVATTTTITMSL